MDNIVATKCYEEGKVGSCGREGKCGDVCEMALTGVVRDGPSEEEIFELILNC